jgi:nucleotide-binding universal stress UspA family protein
MSRLRMQAGEQAARVEADFHDQLRRNGLEGESIVATGDATGVAMEHSRHSNLIVVGSKIVVGWNGSREATRAARDAIPLLRKADSVTVLAVDAERRTKLPGDVPAADIARHLAHHGIKVAVAQTVSNGASETDAPLNYSADLGADLLVVGGYGHARIREFVLGGVTRDLLRSMTLPVLMSH